MFNHPLIAEQLATERIRQMHENAASAQRLRDAQRYPHSAKSQESTEKRKSCATAGVRRAGCVLSAVGAALRAAVPTGQGNEAARLDHRQAERTHVPETPDS